MLEINNISTSYGQIKALRGVSLSVPEGQITCMLGPNGAGKTTLMMTIAGILKPSEGSIRFDDKELVGLSAPKVAGQRIALVPENRLVFGDMSVHENLIAGGYLRIHKDKAGVNEDIERMYARFPRLRERSDQAAGTLSGGEQQMLAIARALILRPRILLMDEPSVGLAPLIVQEIFEIIADLHRDGTTIFLVEQNVHMALKVSHHFYMLEQGTVTFDGTPGELTEDEVIQRAYLGTE